MVLPEHAGTNKCAMERMATTIRSVELPTTRHHLQRTRLGSVSFPPASTILGGHPLFCASPMVRGIAQMGYPPWVPVPRRHFARFRTGMRTIRPDRCDDTA